MGIAMCFEIFQLSSTFLELLIKLNPQMAPLFRSFILRSVQGRQAAIASSFSKLKLCHPGTTSSSMTVFNLVGGNPRHKSGAAVETKCSFAFRAQAGYVESRACKSFRKGRQVCDVLCDATVQRIQGGDLL